MTDEPITISWVRHGESIAQMIEGANDDFPFDLFKTKFTQEEKEFKDDFLAYRTAIINEEFGHYNDFPTLKEAFKEINVNNPKKIIPFADLQKKMTNDVFIKTPFNSELTPSSWFFTPTLTSVGKEEAEKFGGSYLKENANKYALIICSPTVRTIMTALYALDAANMNDKEIMIMPHINEEYITNKNLLERANAGIPVEIIDEIIKLIKKYTKIGIKINTDFYKTTKENSEETDDEYYNGNFEKAKQLIVGNKSKNILAFVHGTFIKKRLTEANAIDNNFFPHNCSLYDITYHGNEASYDVESPYPNAMADVRKNDVKDDKDYDKEFCSLKGGSLRGEINRLWIWGKGKNWEEYLKKCYDKQGDYKCGNVTELKTNYEGGSSNKGGKKNKRTKKNKRSKRTKKHKRKTSKKKY